VHRGGPASHRQREVKVAAEVEEALAGDFHPDTVSLPGPEQSRAVPPGRACCAGYHPSTPPIHKPNRCLVFA
jgi:hypothetical protein